MYLTFSSRLLPGFGKHNDEGEKKDSTRLALENVVNCPTAGGQSKSDLDTLTNTPAAKAFYLFSSVVYRHSHE